MTYDTYTLYKTGKRSYRVSCCSDVVTVPATSGDTSVFELLPEHRGKPLPPLWMHQTPRPLQSTTVRRYGKWQKDNWTTQTCSVKQPNGSYKSVPTYCNRFTQYYQAFVTSTQFPQELESMWATKMRLRVKDTYVNLGTHLVEYRETVDMFAATVGGIRRAWHTFRRNPAKGWRKRLNPCSIPGSVLQHNYGISPLVNDLFDMTEILQSRLGEDIICKMRVFDKQLWERKVHIGSPGYDQMLYMIQRKRATGYFRLKPNWGTYVTLGNPAEWIWEAIPFSFVVDWVYGVGDFLASLDALLGVEMVRCSLGTKVKQRQDDRDWINTQINYRWLVNPFIEKEYYYRQLISAIPIDYPKWDPSDSYHTLINAVSLLAAVRYRNSHTCNDRFNA